MKLNQGAMAICQEIIAEVECLRIGVHQEPGQAAVIDCGVRVSGGLEAGRRMAEVCMAGLGKIRLAEFSSAAFRGPAIQVYTDSPVAACMASQYAGWQISVEKYFAMGSGPMRALAAKETLLETIEHRESASIAVGVLEASKLPPPEVCEYLARQCRVSPENLTLLVARTASQAGTVQVVARSVETAMHKLFELGFDLKRVESGFGVAPLPPVGKNDLAAMGRTNDAILFGGEVTLWVRGDDDTLDSLGPKLPSSASPDFGQPFREIFTRYDGDFYKIDPHLFAPAVVHINNLDTGRSFHFGQTRLDLLEKSFHGS